MWDTAKSTQGGPLECPSGCPVFRRLTSVARWDATTTHSGGESAPVARDLAERPAPGEEGIARRDHAQRVALGVDQHDVTLLRALTDVQVITSEPYDAPHDRPLLHRVGAGEMEVQPVGVVGVVDHRCQT